MSDEDETEDNFRIYLRNIGGTVIDEFKLVPRFYVDNTIIAAIIIAAAIEDLKVEIVGELEMISSRS